MQVNLGRSEQQQPLFVVCVHRVRLHVFIAYLIGKQTCNSGAVQPIMSAFRRHNGLINLCAGVLCRWKPDLVTALGPPVLAWRAQP